MQSRANSLSTNKPGIFSLATGSIILFAFTLSANAQNGSAPSYIDSMSEYEVRSLSGALSPTNGNVTMEDVTPAEWLTNDPSTIGLEAVIIAWSGGAKGIGSKLFVHGGGHSDSANNGLYVYDFSGDSRPTGWQSPLVISSINAVRANSATYSDGKPTAVHTYDGAVYAHHNNHLYRFTGSQYDNGFMTGAAFKFNVATNQWSQLPNYPNDTGGAKTIYDAESRKIFVTMNDTLEGHFFRTDSDSWSGAKGYSGNGFPFDAIGAWDTNRRRGIIVGDGEKSLLTLNFSSESVSVRSFSPTGDTEIFARSGISAVYDPDRDVYWLFGGGTGSPGWSKIYELKADGQSWTTTAHNLTGASISRSSGMLGSYGRFVFMEQWRAIGLVANHGSAVYVIRLPGEPGVMPAAPTNLEAK